MGQLNTTLGSMFNELRVTYQRERNDRVGGVRSPLSRPQVDLPDGTNVKFGTENSSHQNQLDQDIIELTDDLTLLRGSHCSRWDAQRVLPVPEPVHPEPRMATMFSSIENFRRNRLLVQPTATRIRRTRCRHAEFLGAAVRLLRGRSWRGRQRCDAHLRSAI